MSYIVTPSACAGPTRPRVACRSAIAILLAALAAAAIAPAALARGGGCPAAHARVSSVSHAVLQRSVVCLVNRQRHAHGLPGLQQDARLDRSAQRWTNVMVAERLFSHGANFAARISAVGFRWSIAGENIATGYRTPAGVVHAWMASRDHCRNILRPGYRSVGTGVSAGAIPGYGSQGGTWTQDFGRLAGQSAASRNTGPADGCPYP